MADFPADDDIPLAGQLCSHYILRDEQYLCWRYRISFASRYSSQTIRCNHMRVPLEQYDPTL